MSLTHDRTQRVGGGARAADGDDRAARRARCCSACCRFGAASSSRTCGACSARAVPAAEIERLAQAHYAHLWQLVVEFVRFRFLSAQRKRALVRVENLELFVDAFQRGNGRARC